MILVIADNLSGALEIAGIGHSYGLITSIITGQTDNLPVCDLIVFATETRSMTEQEAVDETHSVCQQIKSALPKLTEARHAAMTPLQRAQALAHPNEVLHIFKKTDSLLRGHVHMELRALIEESRYEQVMYLPANPSKGLTIRGGRFFVQGTPIDQTSHKNDLDHPILTANVADAISVRPGSRLRICDAEDQQDVQRAVRLALNNHTPTLLAGSTDLFCTFLSELGYKPSRHKQFPGLSEKGSALIVCSSTASTDISHKPFIQRHNMAVIPLPGEVYESIVRLSITPKEGTDRWLARFKQAMVVNGKVGSYFLTIPYSNTDTLQGFQALCTTTADMTQRLVAQSSITEMVIEGGATAYAIINKLGWKRFQISQLITPGVVRLNCLDATHTHLTIKTGHGEWGDLFA